MKSPKKSIGRKKPIKNIKKSYSKAIRPKKKSTSDMINVVLDLDNTAIFSLESDKVSKNKPKSFERFKSHDMGKEYVVFERPGLQSFLDWLEKNFKITIWSAATSDYVDFIRKKVFGKRKVHHVFHSDHCEESQKHYGDHYIKNLQLLWDKYHLKGFGPSNTLIIDDLKYTTNPQPNNSIHIKKFKEDTIRDPKSNDTELMEIKRKLTLIKKHYDNDNDKNNPNFKLVDKSIF